MKITHQRAQVWQMIVIESPKGTKSRSKYSLVEFLFDFSNWI